MPAPQYGVTPADAAAKSNRNAEVKAFFASGQVRPIRVHSEVTQRSLRGHPEATQRPLEALSGHPLRGPSAARRGHQRRSEGTQRHSEAIRGLSETILGNHSQSGALSGTQRALNRAPGPNTATRATSRAEHVRPCVRVCVCSQHLQAPAASSGIFGHLWPSFGDVEQPAAAAAKAAADKAAAKAAADKAAAKAAADKAVAKAAADKAAAAKAQQDAEDAQVAAAIAASLAISDPVTPPPLPLTLATSLATSRFIDSYDQPERKPDQLYARITTERH